MSSIWFVRHGEALHNVHHALWKYDNEAMFGLTMAGVLGTLHVAKVLAASAKTYQLWHSPSVRTLQTAHIIKTEISKVKTAPVLVEHDWLREIGTAYHPEFCYKTFSNDPHYKKSNGESFSDRLQLLADLPLTKAFATANSNVVVVSHMHAIPAVLGSLLIKSGQLPHTEALRLHNLKVDHSKLLGLNSVTCPKQGLRGWLPSTKLSVLLPSLNWTDYHHALVQEANAN